MNRIGFAWVLFLMAGIGCGTSIDGDRQGRGVGGNGHGGNTPPLLRPSPNNSDHCPNSLPPFDSSCDGFEGLDCLYIGDLCAEFAVCSAVTGCYPGTGGSGGHDWEEYNYV